MSIARTRTIHRLATAGLALAATVGVASTTHAAEGDTDPVAAFSLAAAGTVLEGDVGTTEIGFFVTGPVAATEGCTLEVVTVPGASTADLATEVELDEVNGVFIAAGSTSGFVTGNVLGDTAIESDETVTVAIRAASISGFPACPVVEGATATLTVRDDDRPQLTLAGQDVVEGNSGSRPMPFAIRAAKSVGERCELGVTVDQPDQVHVALRSGPLATVGTASPDDIAAPAGTVSLEVLAGATSIGVVVEVLGDVVAEDDEAVRVILTPGPGDALPDCITSPVEATALILNDDEPTLEPETPTSEVPAPTVPPTVPAATEPPATQPPAAEAPTTTAAPTTTGAPTTSAPTTAATTTTAAPATTATPEVLSQGPATTVAAAIPVVSGQLPTTGGETGSLVGLAAVALGAGGVGVLIARLRRRPA